MNTVCEICETCGMDKYIIHGDASLICKHCGDVEFILIDSDKPSYKDPPKEISYFAYKRINHFNEWLAQFQAKETTDIPQELYDQILLEIKKERIDNMRDLKQSKVREILKKLKQNKYYEHVPHIINKINGLPPPIMSRETEEELRRMFKEIQIPFAKFCPKDRKNFLSYSYVLHKFVQLLELDQFLDCFILLKSREKLHQQDLIWKQKHGRGDTEKLEFFTFDSYFPGTRNVILDEGTANQRTVYDDIFRLVFEDWSQEIDRAINSMRKDLNITDETEILLAGSAGYIQFFDEFIQLETNIKTKFFNPIRNLAVAPEFSIESLGFNPSILTASIGSGINIKNAASILPKNLKQEENLRWINRGGIVLAAISLVFCIIFSINKKVNVEWLKFEIDPMQIERNSLGYVQDKHSQLSENKGNVEDQLKILSYDTRYSDRILAINRLLSFYTPKEIKISELSPVRLNIILLSL